MRRGKKLLSFAVSLLVLTSLLLPLIHPGTVHADAALPSQPDFNPISVSTCQELQDINNDLHATYTLSNDLDCSGSGFVSIGEDVNGGTYSFEGRFYGEGHTISNLDTALFGQVTSGIVTNLNLSGTLTADSYNSANFLASTFSFGIIADVHVTGTLLMTESSSTGVGLVSNGDSLNIMRSSAVLDVQVSGSQAEYAGLVYNLSGSRVQDSYTVTNVTSITGGVEHAGGIALYSTNNQIINSYTSGSISDPGNVHEIGGFAYYTIGTDSQIVNSFSSLQGVGQCNGANGCAAFSVIVGDGLDLSTDYFDKTAMGTTRCVGNNTITSCHLVNADGSQGNYFKNNTTNAPLNNWDFTNVWATTVGLPSLRAAASSPQPDPVDQLTANIGSSTSIDVSWTQPGNTGSTPLLGQEVYYQKEGETDWQLASATQLTSYISPSGNFTGTNFTISGLRPSTSYTIEVVYYNQDGYYSTATVTGVTGTPGFGLINTCQQLQDMTNNLADNYELGRNLDCSDTVNWSDGAGFLPIGCQDEGGSFIGVLEGNNYTISNLYIDGGTCYNGALFLGTDGALIQDLNFANPIVHTANNNAYSSAIVTINDHGSTFNNIHITVNAPDLDQTLAAGMIGENSGSVASTINRSSFTGSVNGDFLYANQFAGLMGSQEGTTIINDSYAQFTVTNTGAGTYGGVVGGLVGSVDAPLEITNSYASLINDATNAIFDQHDSFLVTGGLIGYASVNNIPSVTHSFARTQVLTGSPPPVTKLTGGILGYLYDNENIAPVDMSGNYFDADLAGTNQCAATEDGGPYRPVTCSAITGQPNYFYNNSTNPPLNSWDFDNIWQMTSTLPVFGVKSRNAITPIPASRLTPKPGPTPKATINTATSVPHSPAAIIAERKAQAAASVNTTPPAPQGLIGQLKELLSHVPAVVLVNFPYVLVGLLLLAALVLLIEMLRQNQRLKQLNLLLAEQRSVAEKRDTFWHLAANYLRAPITLLMGGVDLLALSKQESKETKQLAALSERLQAKVANIMKQIEGSHTLQGIKAPKTEKPRIIWRSVGFWLPLITVAVLVVLTNYVAHAWRNLQISTISLVSQLLVFILAGVLLYWVMGALGLVNRRLRNAEQLLKQQERALDDARLHLMQRTATDLDADVTHVQALLGKLPARTQEAQSIAQEGASRLRHLVDSFHLLVTAQNHRLGGLSPASAHTSLDRALKEAMAELEPEIAAKGLTIDLPAKHGLRIPGSPDLNSQVLSSVLANAIAFSPSGSTIRLDIEQAGEDIKLQIADHGPGIKPGQQAHLFEPFTKADGLTGLQLDHDGLGISLYLDRQIMDHVGGQITVQSDVGHGTVVELQWPRATSAKSHPGMVVQPSV